MAQLVVGMADSARLALAAHIVAAARAVVGFAVAHIAVDIVADIAAPAAGLAGIAAASHIVAHIVEVFAGDNIALRARPAARGIAPAARIVVVVAGSFARGMGFAASARPVGRAAARVHSFAALGIVVVARIVADFGRVGIVPADSFGLLVARNFARASR